MHADTLRADTTPSLETQTPNEAAPQAATEWVTPDFSEQSTCAEICAYVFHH